MEIKEVNVNDLIPYEFNNKIHNKEQVNRIANSIKEFWFLQPLVIDKNNILIVWHGRLEWAKKLWLKTVPCVYADNLTEQQIKKYRILDNKLNESERDIENLKLELDELPDLNIWELELEVKDLFPELVDQEEEKAVEEDEAPEVQKEAKMVRGGIYSFSEIIACYVEILQRLKMLKCLWIELKQTWCFPIHRTIQEWLKKVRLSQPGWLSSSMTLIQMRNGKNLCETSASNSIVA